MYMFHEDKKNCLQKNVKMSKKIYNSSLKKHDFFLQLFNNGSQMNSTFTQTSCLVFFQLHPKSLITEVFQGNDITDIFKKYINQANKITKKETKIKALPKTHFPFLFFDFLEDGFQLEFYSYTFTFVVFPRNNNRQLFTL